GGALAQFESANDGIRDHAKNYGLNFRGSAEIERIALESHIIVLRLIYKTKWPGANWITGEVGRCSGGNDADGRAFEVPEKRCIRLFEMKDYGCGIGCFDGSDQAKG